MTKEEKELKKAERLATKENAKAKEKELEESERVLAKKREVVYQEMIAKQKESLKHEKIAPKDSYISLQHINKIYPNRVQAVYDFNLEIKQKEFIVFVGPSGCGKSTTLRMIAGLEDITGGDLFIDHEFANELEPKDRDVAMVFQSYALYPHMTVYENMAFGLQMRHVDKDEIDRRVRHAAEILQITEYLDRKPKALSGGQCQRVALGRAIVKDAKVFLMDEPLSNLDAKLRVQMRSEIVKLHNSLGATTIYVTHDQIEAMTMATRIVIMSKGVVQQIGSPRIIYNHPANTFVASFIGSPAMNIVNATYTKKAIQLGEKGSIKIGKDVVEAHDKFYKGEIEKAHARLAEIKELLVKFALDEDAKKHKGETTLTPEAVMPQVEAEMLQDEETIKLNKNIKYFEECLAAESHKILFGIRPEDVVEVGKSSLIKNPSDVIKATLTIAELLGNEYYAHLDFNGQDLIGKVDAELLLDNGQDINVVFNLDKYSLFDDVTGKNINPYVEK